MFMTSASCQDPETLDAQRADDARYNRESLREMIDMGRELTRLLLQRARAQAEAAAPDASVPDHSIGYNRLARAVRRTVLLAEKLAQPPKPAVSAAALRHHDKARTRIIREVEDVIQRRADGDEDEDEESLNAELNERVDGIDVIDDIEDRPVADIIADIVRDLGLAHIPGTHPWKRRTPKDIAALAARVAASPVRQASPRHPPPRPAANHGPPG